MRTTANSKTWVTAERWSETEARAALEALKESGESVLRFAARHGIAAHRLYGWRRRLATSAAPMSTFVEVGAELNGRGRDERVEIALTTGDVVRVAEGIDEMTLRVVITALRAGLPC